jgi:hypothetical protein
MNLISISIISNMLIVIYILKNVTIIEIAIEIPMIIIIMKQDEEEEQEIIMMMMMDAVVLYD